MCIRDSNKNTIYPTTRNELISTPVVIGNRMYIANGQDPEHGEGVGHLWCIDVSKKGDINKDGKIRGAERMNRTISTVTVYNNMVFAPDFSGFFHCLDATTGEHLW